MGKNKIEENELSLIRNAIENKSSVEFSCFNLTPDQKDRFLDILNAFLDECNQSQLFNCLSYCLIELLDNASKANAKRIYFQKLKLNINDANDYSTGMKDFRTNLNINNSESLDKIEDSFLQVKLHLSSNDNIYMKVKNNTKITEEEYKRILNKIEMTNNYNTIQDAIGDIDSTEGCGLGIVSIVLMLKNLGLDKENLSFNLENNETEAIIKIPVDVFSSLEEL